MQIVGSGPLSYTLADVPGPAALAESKKIDLRTHEGVAAVKGQRRYHDVRIVEVAGKNREWVGQQDLQLRAQGQRARLRRLRLGDHRAGEIEERPGQRADLLLLVPHQGDTSFRGRGQVGLLPDHRRRLRRGSWVDGKLPHKPGDAGGPIVAGFNVPNRVELKNAHPGRVYQIAVFGINGPISDTPTNWIFLGPTFLELVDKP